jgi:hypothetical protein
VSAGADPRPFLQAAAYERLWRAAEQRQGGGSRSDQDGAHGDDHLAVAQQAQKALEDAVVEAEREKNELLKQMDQAR